MKAIFATKGYATRAMDQINGIYNDVLKSDAKYGFMIDIGTLK